MSGKPEPVVYVDAEGKHHKARRIKGPDGDGRHMLVVSLQGQVGEAGG